MRIRFLGKIGFRNVMNDRVADLVVFHPDSVSATRYPSFSCQAYSFDHWLFAALFLSLVQFSSVQSLSHVRLFTTPWTTARQASLCITCTQILAQSLLPANERPSLYCRLSPFMTQTTSVFHCLSAFDLPFLHFFREKTLIQAPEHPPSDTVHILQLQLLLPFQVSLTSGCTKQPLFSKYTSVHQGIAILHKLCLSSEVSFLTFSSQQICILPSKVFPTSKWPFP